MSREPEGPVPTVEPLVHSSDAAACARLMCSSEPWVTLGRQYETSLRIVTDPSREVYLVRYAGEVAGFFILSMAGALVGYIQTVCIRPDLQGKGLGTFAIRWAESRILRESPNVFMCVSSFNQEAYRLYRRLGYSVVGELTDYLVRGHSEILLRKSLGPWSEYDREAG